MSMLLMTMSKDDLPERLIERIKTVLTRPTTVALTASDARRPVSGPARFFATAFSRARSSGRALLADPGDGG
jgi:hypothetical protein